MSSEQTSVGTASPSLLAYFFADLLVAASRTKITGVEVPCRDAAVRVNDLGSLLFGLAFWDLQSRGVVKLELVQKKRLGLIPSKSVMVTRQGDSAPFPLENALLTRIPGSSARSVHQIVFDWYGQDVHDPARVPVNTVRQEALSLGYMSAVDAGRGAIGSKLLGATKLDADCARIAEMEAAFAELKARWEQFQAAEPNLSKALLDECSGAIKSRREEREGPDNDI